MKRLLRKIYASYINRKWRKKVTILGKEVKFYKTAKVLLSCGAQPDNIVIENHVRIYGHLGSCANGTIRVGDFVQIGPGSIIRSVTQVDIGALTSISTNVIISDNNSHSVNPFDREIMQKTPAGSPERSWINSDSAPIIIGRNCWIGENSRICKGVVIGDGAVVAANAVVTKDIPANSIAAGNPAKIVKTDIDRTARRYFQQNKEK